MPDYVDLYEVVPDIHVDYSRYWESEQEVINPALRNKGYKVGSWQTGEGDSFGPLSRIAHATDPNGQSVTVVYG